MQHIVKPVQQKANFLKCKIVLKLFNALLCGTVNFLNIRTPKKFVVITLKIWIVWLYHRVMSPNNAEGKANSVDSDQTAPLGAVWSGSALFAQAYLSENFGSSRYTG